MARLLALFLCGPAAALPATSDADPRWLDSHFKRAAPGQLEAEWRAQGANAPTLPFRPFSAEYVKRALATPTNWTAKGAVTPVKSQGPHGYCGTFGRVGSAEGQFALKAGKLVSFSEEELCDCIGWDKDQFSWFSPKGFTTSAAYPYNETSYPPADPPVPGNPCKYDPEKTVPGSAGGFFNATTGNAPTEDQMAAFIHHNGPVSAGINAAVFGLREKGCEKDGSCFITEAMCNEESIKGKPIDHSITVVGYGTDPTNGPYWLIKNSWSENFANGGYINVARGVKCASMCSSPGICGHLFTAGDPSAYYEQ